VDPSGLDLKEDDDAIAKANVIAIGVSLDKPAVDPERHIAVLNDSRDEISRVPVYSKQSTSTTWVLARMSVVTSSTPQQAAPGFGLSSPIWQFHLRGGTHVSFAFQRRQTALDGSDDVDNLL
jgi:hypothetical protein